MIKGSKMEDKLKFNAKIFDGFDCAIGREDYFLNLIYIYSNTFLLKLPLYVWIFKDFENIEYIFKQNSLFYLLPLFIKITYIMGIFITFILTVNNIIRRNNDINGNSRILSVMIYSIGLFFAHFGFIKSDIAFIFGTLFIVTINCFMLFKKGKTASDNFDNISNKFSWEIFFGLPALKTVTVVLMFAKSAIKNLTYLALILCAGFFLFVSAGFLGKYAKHVDLKNKIVQYKQNVILIIFKSYEINSKENKFYINSNLWQEYRDYHSRVKLFNLVSDFAAEKNGTSEIEELTKTKIYDSKEGKILAEYKRDTKLIESALNSGDIKKAFRAAINTYRFYD